MPPVFLEPGRLERHLAALKRQSWSQPSKSPEALGRKAPLGGFGFSTPNRHDDDDDDDDDDNNSSSNSNW